MNEKRKKGGGCAAVEQYILDRLRDCGPAMEPFVRITGQEIADTVGITPQSVNEHIRYLVRKGAIIRRRRCYFGDPSHVFYGRVGRWMQDRLQKHDWIKELFFTIDLRELAVAVGAEITEVEKHVDEWLRHNSPCSQDRFHFLNRIDTRPTPSPEIDAQTGKRRDGYEAVRDHVLEKIRTRRCKEDLFVRLNGEEIGAQVGLAPASVRRYLRDMIHRGVICRAADNSPWYATVSEIHREQLRAWIKHQMELQEFADIPILFFNVTEAAKALKIPDFWIEEGIQDLCNMDAAFRVCRMIEYDDP